MYHTLLILHSVTRWLVLLFIAGALLRSLSGYVRNRPFTKTDDAFRHWAATVAHIQLMIGIVLYTQSPLIKSFWGLPKDGLRVFDLAFFSLIHILLMFISIVILTTGSALAKRRQSDKEKFRTILVWFSIALLLIFLAIPWPFSPLSNRPYFRT
jgi:hypothetical protein